MVKEVPEGTVAGVFLSFELSGCTTSFGLSLPSQSSGD